MARIDVENGKSFEFKNPNVDTKEIERVASECRGMIIRAASPFMDTIRIFNKTKRCHVFIGFSEGRLIITVENPQDEVFDLNEPDPISPSGDITNAAAITPTAGH